MFGIKSTDTHLLEAMINDLFDIAEGKRNRYRYAKSTYNDSKLEKISTLIEHRLTVMIEAKQKDMLAMGELILALDQMKSGVFKPSNIEAYGSEVSVIASSFSDFTLLLSQRFDEIVKVLSAYSANDFTGRVDKGNLKGDLSFLIDGVNKLSTEITHMLATSLQNGLNLQSEASSLRLAMDHLSNASNEQAANKSNEGMSIANELTRGFEVIAEKIEQTTMLVQDVSNASREQMQGIGQINTAVTQLDQMTQENAKIAANVSQTSAVIQDLSDEIYREVETKQFVGKNEILRR